MNYYNPYIYNIPISNTQKIGLLSRLFGGKNITFSGILTNTQKILNVANQTIPLVKQVKPVFGNAKTIFKVMNEFKKSNKSISKKNEANISNSNIKNEEINSDGPIFFV